MNGIRFEIDSPFANELRDQVLMQVAIGVTDPAEAEKFAYDMEIGPISFMPDPDVATDEDLLDLEYWTMGMATAWIAWRRLDAVRECHPRYAKTRRNWVRLPNSRAVRHLLEPLGLKPDVLPGFIVAKGLPASVAGMVARERKGAPPLPYLPTPEIAVVDALGIVVTALMKTDPLLSAHADSVLSGSTEALSPAAWATLAVGISGLPPGANVDWTRDTREIDLLYTGDALFRVPYHSGAGPAYTGARMERQQVQYLADHLHLLAVEPSRQIELITAPSPDSIDVAPALQSVPDSGRKRGRKVGSKNWDASYFMEEYRLNLEQFGLPGLQNPSPWTSEESAAKYVLDIFVNGLPSGDRQPSRPTSLAWGKEAIAKWNADGSPRKRTQNPENSDNP